MVTKVGLKMRKTRQTAAELAAGVTPVYEEYDPLNVLRYGENTTPGTTDMQPAIQAAIDVASINGGEVYIPAGTYLLTASTLSGTVTHHLSIVADNVSIKGEGKATLLKTVSANTAIFLIQGSGKPDGIANWETYQARESSDTTVYTMSGTPAKGDMSVSLATAAEAGNFSAGDLCLIRTGQTTGLSAEQPDGEINEILTADAGTGVLTFVRPLAKPYAQENYDVGSSGVTSVGGAGTAAPFGVSNIEDRMLKNISLTDFAIDSTAGRHALVGSQIDGFTVSRIRADITNQGFISMGCYRDVRFADNICHTRGAGATTWHLPADSCCVDVWMVNNILSSERVNYVHVHEGANRVHVLNNSILNTPSASDENGISIRSRARDVVVDGNHVINAGNGAAIYVDSTCDGGGVIKNNTIAGTAFTEAISVASPNWFVQHSSAGDGNVSFFGKASSGYTYGPAESLSTWVYDDAQNMPLGVLPAYSFVSRVTVHLTEVFNSDGTDLLSVGWDDDVDGLLTAIDVSSAVGTGVRQFTGANDNSLAGYTPSNVSVDREFDADTVAVDELADVVGTIIADRQAQQFNAIKGYNSTKRALEAYYVNGGTEPTTGKALVVVEYYRTQRQA